MGDSGSQGAQREAGELVSQRQRGLVCGCCLSWVQCLPGHGGRAAFPGISQRPLGCISWLL